MEPKKLLVYYQIIHVNNHIIHKSFSVKVDFEHQIDSIRFKSTSYLIYDTKIFQILYSTYHELNLKPCFFIFLLTQNFNLLKKKILSF
jgi:hypothetical protein